MQSRNWMLAGLAVAFGVPGAAQAAVWRVDHNTPASPSQQDGSTWDRAFPDLQDLCDDDDFQADANPEVWVADGTYKPRAEYRPDPGEGPDSRTRTYVIPHRVEIYGGFRGYSPSVPGEQFRNERDPEVNLTILSGDFEDDDDVLTFPERSEEHTSELQSLRHLV